MTETETYINIPPYTFAVKRILSEYNQRLIGLNFRIGGEYKCITISYRFESGSPISASIPLLSYEPECSIGSPLQKGAGTELLIKAAITYCYEQVPSIPIFTFDDTSHIDCLVTEGTRPPRKLKKPLNLAYLSIVYHGKTWYERIFNAKMIDATKYAMYQESLGFLTDSSAKLPFLQFLELVQPSSEQIIYMEEYYLSTSTYRDFFERIPKHQRCMCLFGWINRFMEHYLKWHKEWMIDARNMSSIQSGGSRRTRRNHRHVFNYEKPSNF